MILMYDCRTYRVGYGVDLALDVIEQYMPINNPREVAKPMTISFPSWPGASP
jgi:hypothetical protein